MTFRKLARPVLLAASVLATAGHFAQAQPSGSAATSLDANLSSAELNAGSEDIQAFAAPTVIDTASYGGHTYHLLSRSTWADAESVAQSLGGHLVTVDSSEENDWIYSTFRQSLYDNEMIESDYEIQLWIGYTDAVTEGTYKWVSGATSSYTRWYAGEPNNGAGIEDYTVITNSNGGSWNDLSGSINCFAVVEVVDAVAAPAPSYSSGIPIDLSGTYLAARNAVVGATSDGDGIGTSGMVQEPSASWRFTPFSKTLKKPSARQNLDLRGNSYGFDVDLGDPARWPNPSTLTNWFAGNAADGHEGSTLVIRAAASNGNAAIKLSDMNGLRIMFYRKDGKFFGHVANLWYSQDVPLPGCSVATQYRVQVNVAYNGEVVVAFQQRNGAGAGALKIQNLVGGSIENGGLTAASFLVQMANVTPAGQTSSFPTQASVSRFWTTAGTNALYAFTESPYLSTKDQSAMAVFGLYSPYLGQKMMGYRASLQLSQAGSLSYYQGQYENDVLFEAAGAPAFAPNVAGRFDHAQSTAVLAKATQESLLLESLNFTAAQGASGGNLKLNVLAPYAGGPLKSGYKQTNGTFVNATVYDSNGVVLDPAAPTLGAITVQTVSGTVYTAKTTAVSLTATDVGSGLADSPLLTATITNNKGVVTTQTVRLGSVNPTSGVFGTTLTLPLGTVSLQLSATVMDRAGNASAPSTRTVAVALPATSTLSVPIQLTGFAANAPVTRLVRIVLGRKGGDGVVGTHARIVINKVVTFTKAGVGTATLTVADGLPEFPTAGITHVWVKDPFHTLGSMAPLKLTNSVYSLNGVTKVFLTPGDVTNNNVTDSADYSIFTTCTYKTVPASTTVLADTAALIPSGQLNLDLNGDGKFDAKDVALMNLYFGKVGDAEPCNYNG